MLTVNWLYSAIIILYALSVLGYFIDFLQNNQKANRFAFWLLSIVWIFQTIFFIVTVIELKRFPILTPVEGLYFFAWGIVTLSLVINWFFRMDFFVFFANVLGFIIMSIHLFAPREQVSTILTEQLISELLFIHITMAFLSYTAFSISFIFSIMYILQFQMLKNKQWSKRLIRFGSLSQLEQMSFYCNMLGVPLLLLSLILGLVWAGVKLDSFNYFDSKVVISFIVLLTYGSYLYQKVAKNRQGKFLALWNNAAFLIVLINIFLSSMLSNFHLWYQ